MFGRYDTNMHEFTENSFLYLWNREYSEISDEAYRYLGRAHDSFTDILNDNIGDVQESLKKGVDGLDELTGPFEDANDQIGDVLSSTRRIRKPSES